MFKPIMWWIAIVVVVFIASYPQSFFAEEFTSADVLTWKNASQDSYFRTSVSMAGVIASQNRREAAQCIDQWYFEDKDIQQELANHIRNVLGQYPDYNPQAVIFAIIRKACGKLF